MYRCHFILECCVMFSGVKLSIRSFVLFLAAEGELCLNVIICRFHFSRIVSENSPKIFRKELTFHDPL